MTTYKHIQIGYPMLVITLVVLVFFAWLQIIRLEPSPLVLLRNKFCHYCHNGADSVYSRIVFDAYNIY
jgi:hypothetical protein